VISALLQRAWIEGQLGCSGSTACLHSVRWQSNKGSNWITLMAGVRELVAMVVAMGMRRRRLGTATSRGCGSGQRTAAAAMQVLVARAARLLVDSAQQL
jgi:hypothetical protein